MAFGPFAFTLGFIFWVERLKQRVFLVSNCNLVCYYLSKSRVVGKDFVRRKHVKRFSTTICLALLVVAMTFTLAGCKSPKQDVGDIVITAPETETPVVEEPAPVEEVKEEAPVVEEPAPTVEEPAPVEEAPAVEAKEEAPVVEEPKTEVAVVYKPVAKKYTFAGYELTVIADKGRAVISYPSIIAKADIDAAAQAAVAAYGKAYDLSGVYYDVNEKEHVLTVYYPESWGMEELALAEQIVMNDLPGYAAAAYAALQPAKEEAPVEEEIVAVEEPEAEIAVVYSPVSQKYTFAGYELSVVADKGHAVISYPSIIAKADIDAAAQAAVAAYGKAYDLSGVYYDVNEKEHVLTVYYPESWGMEELALAEQIVMKDLPGYAAAAYAALQPAKEEAPVEEEIVAEEVVEPAFYTRDIELYGYKASIIASGNKVRIDYPSFVTTAEVRAAAEAVYAAYGQYLQGSTLDIHDGYGFAILTLAYDLTEADFNYAADLVEAQLPAYVQSLFAQAPAEEEPAEVEEVAVVAEAPAVEETPAPVEEVKEEAPVVEEQPEAPKQEETKTETPAAQPAATPAAEPAPAKKSNAGLIILIIVLVLVAAAAVVVVLKKKKN